MSFLNFYIIIFLIDVLFKISAKEIKYEKSYIDDMHTSFFNTKKEKIYYVGNLIEGYTIIGFSDLDSDKYTDIISYQKNEATKNFTFYAHYYDDDIPGFKKPQKLFDFNLNDAKDGKFSNSYVRNLYVGSFFANKNKKFCFIITFENKNEEELNHDLLHYIICENQYEGKVFDSITSNILIMNRDEDKNLRILFSDEKNLTNATNENSTTIICKLGENIGDNCSYENFENYLIPAEQRDSSNRILSDKKNYSYVDYTNSPLSLVGGLAYIDVSGNCIPDIILSRDHNESVRTIEVYIANKTDKFILKDVIKLNTKENTYGAFAITRVNDNTDGDYAPMMDILIPEISSNKIIYLRNKRKISYKWSHYFCDKYDDKYKTGDIISVFDDNITNSDKYSSILEFDARKIGKDNRDIEEVTIDNSFPTVIRTGDFLASSNPGIILKQKVTIKGETTSYISLYERKSKKKNFLHYLSFDLNEIKEHNKDDVDVGDEFEKGLFFDIDEAGTLSMILTTKNNKNYFFFNYQRNIYFLKSKLMNDEDLYYDINLGASFRYIVTDKDGDRHMDASFQLAQTSDMNIPLPYSLIGLDDTNNYVEYFETESGNILVNKSKVSFEKGSEKNYKGNSPIIPNTQMMISKYYKSNRKTIEWNVDLIVQPMEQIWLFFIIVVFVLLIVLGIIIYLHIKEVKEEQKETTKFKSWFA